MPWRCFACMYPHPLWASSVFEFIIFIKFYILIAIFQIFLYLTLFRRVRFHALVYWYHLQVFCSSCLYVFLSWLCFCACLYMSLFCIFMSVCLCNALTDSWLYSELFTFVRLYIFYFLSSLWWIWKSCSRHYNENTLTDIICNGENLNVYSIIRNDTSMSLSPLPF